jgi:ketosteroid isomerase-like protein
MLVKSSLSEEIGAANRRFMERFANGDIPGVADCYTEDAQFLVAHMEAIRGRAAIQALFKLGSGQGHTLHFSTQELDGYGTTAVEIGEYTRKQSNGQILDRGKYLVIWKRVGDDWKIHRDMINTSLPKPA